MGPILHRYITRTLQLLVYLKDAESHILHLKSKSEIEEYIHYSINPTISIQKTDSEISEKCKNKRVNIGPQDG